MFFAWFCNMAMHIGMSDLSVFRFAKKSWYGIATASGMYVGHFMAWMSAAILYALQLHRNPGDISVAPGPMAYRACGIAGLLCVVIAGWTTANPTIYRAGLAFQAIMPTVSRFKVTLVTGLVATVAGLFPAIVMKLLGFVMLYGMLLMPMGAVVFVDFWLMPRLGLRQYYAELARDDFNWAAAYAWFLTLGACAYLALSGTLAIYFVSLPGWFLAAAMYVAASAVYQRGMHLAVGFRMAAQFVSWLSAAAIVAAIVPLFRTSDATLEQSQRWMTIATVVWFIATPMWMLVRRDPRPAIPPEDHAPLVP
jgi:purine-cytosine permease-like protein